MFAGMGDEVTDSGAQGDDDVALTHSRLNVTNGVEEVHHAALVSAWCELWVGALRAQQQLKDITYELHPDRVEWRIRPAG